MPFLLFERSTEGRLLSASKGCGIHLQAEGQGWQAPQGQCVLVGPLKFMGKVGLGARITGKRPLSPLNALPCPLRVPHTWTPVPGLDPGSNAPGLQRASKRRLSGAAPHFSGNLGCYRPACPAVAFPAPAAPSASRTRLSPAPSASEPPTPTRTWPPVL